MRVTRMNVSGVSSHFCSPYGQMSTTGTTTTPAFGYAGMVYNASTGLDLTLYRAYDPQLRRWLSRDPIGMMSGLALIRAGLMMPLALGGSGARWVGLNLAINRYPYVGNDPLNWGDPEGQFPWRPFVQRPFILHLTFAILGHFKQRYPESVILPVQPPSVCFLKRK